MPQHNSQGEKQERGKVRGRPGVWRNAILYGPQCTVPYITVLALNSTTYTHCSENCITPEQRHLLRHDGGSFPLKCLLVALEKYRAPTLVTCLVAFNEALERGCTLLSAHHKILLNNTNSKTILTVTRGAKQNGRFAGHDKEGIPELRQRVMLSVTHLSLLRARRLHHN